MFMTNGLLLAFYLGLPAASVVVVGRGGVALHLARPLAWAIAYAVYWSDGLILLVIILIPECPRLLLAP